MQDDAKWLTPSMKKYILTNVSQLDNSVEFMFRHVERVTHSRTLLTLYDVRPGVWKSLFPFITFFRHKIKEEKHGEAKSFVKSNLLCRR